jgi:dipeptidyl aminopeptidase/acylaminoacyl peptidase
VTSSPDSPRRTATPISTLASYESYTIESLRSRTYGGGDITIVKTLEEADSFTRYLIRYPSDGLTIYGFANIPKGEGPFPVIIAIHGYVNPAAYQTVDYTASALDVITRSGYIVIHPNLRNYPPSDDGDNLFRVGMAVDVLNLIALVKAGSGPAKLFATAAPEEIGLWAHSMGGNIALRVLTVSPDVKAAVLFAAMSGDEQKNSELFARDSSDPIYQEELAAPPAVFQQISPMYYYRYITAPIQLHHGGVDRVIPLAWAEETCDALAKVHVQIECLYYPTEEHTFRSRVADQVFGALSRFYATYLAP